MAKGPGAAKSVGKVSVRVVPDTSKFREELAAQLKKELAGFSVKIPVSVDTKQLGTVRKQLAQASNDLNRLDFSKSIDFDMDPFELALARVVTGVHNLQQGLANVVTRSKQMAISFRDSVNLVGQMRKYWAGVRDEVGSTGKTVTRVLSVRAFKSIVGSVQSVGRGFRNIGLQANRGLRGLAGLTAATGRGLLSMASGAAKATASLIPTSRAALILFAVLAGGAPIVGLIAGLLAGLPSLAFAVAAPIAAIALGFDGIKAAAGVLSDEVDHLKASLSQRFEEGLTPVFEQLQSIFPVLERGLLKVTDGTVAWAGAFTDVITSARGSAQLETILNNVGQLMQDMTPFVTNFTEAFLTMAEAGSNQFDLLAKVMNDFAISFNQMIERVVSNGTFAAAIEGLAKVTDSLLQVFVQLFEAGLQVMAQVGGPLSTLIAAFGNALVAILPILGTITNVIAGILAPVLNALAVVFQMLAPVIEMIGTILVDFFVSAFQALLPLITQVAAVVAQVLLVAFQALAPILDLLVPVLAQLAAILGDVLLAVFQAIAPAIEPLVNMLGQLALIVAQVLVQALEALAPLFEVLAQFLADVLKELEPLMPSIGELAEILGGLLVDALKIAVPLLLDIAKVVFPAIIGAIRGLTPVIKGLINIFREIVGAIAPIVQAIVGALLPAFYDILDAVQPVFDNIVNIIKGAFDIIKGIFDVVIGVLTGDWARAWEGIKSILSGAMTAIWEAIKLGFNLVITFFVELPGAILGALGSLLGLLWDVGSDIIQGLWDGIKWLWKTVDDFFKNIGGVIGDFFAGCATWLWDAGKNLVQGLWNGWKSYFDDFEQAVINDGNTLVDNINGIFEIFSPSRVFRRIGEYLGMGLILGMESQRLDVFRTGHDMANQVMEGFGTPSLSLDLVSAIEDTTPAALKAVDSFAQQASGIAQTEFSAQLFGDGSITPIADQITEAMDGVEVKMDSRPVGKIIRKNDTTQKRRG